jgi:Fe-S-cluster containining protein
MMDRWEREAHDAIPPRMGRVEAGEILPDDLVWCWTTKEFLRADDPGWLHRPTLAEDCVCVIRQPKADTTGYTQRKFVMKKPSEPDYNCRTCGACCAFYQKVEVFTSDPHSKWLWENGFVEFQDLTPVMKQKNGVCIAFNGTVGQKAECTIYENRPAVCRDFEAGSAPCRTVVFVEINRKGKTLFKPDDPDSWPKEKPPEKAASRDLQTDLFDSL